MTDVERGGFGTADEDRLPWLEAVEDEDEDAGVGVGKLIAAVILALIFIGLVIGGIFWLRDRNEPGGSGELIAAPPGDYKVPAGGPTANGMTVQGEGDAAYATSDGQDINAAINPAAQPEVPIAGAVANIDASAVRTQALPPSNAAPGAPAAPAEKPAPTPPAPPAAAPKPAPVAKVADAKPKPAPAIAAAPAPAASRATGGTIQLGAFNSEAIATGEWSKLARQFPELGKLSRTVTTVEVGGKTLYRLRASGVGAREACKALKSAGKPCNAV